MQKHALDIWHQQYEKDPQAAITALYYAWGSMDQGMFTEAPEEFFTKATQWATTQGRAAA